MILLLFIFSFNFFQPYFFTSRPRCVVIPFQHGTCLFGLLQFAAGHETISPAMNTLLIFVPREFHHPATIMTNSFAAAIHTSSDCVLGWSPNRKIDDDDDDGLRLWDRRMCPPAFISTYHHHHPCWPRNYVRTCMLYGRWWRCSFSIPSGIQFPSQSGHDYERASIPPMTVAFC